MSDEYFPNGICGYCGTALDENGQCPADSNAPVPESDDATPVASASTGVERIEDLDISEQRMLHYLADGNVIGESDNAYSLLLKGLVEKRHMDNVITFHIIPPGSALVADYQRRQANLKQAETIFGDKSPAEYGGMTWDGATWQASAERQQERGADNRSVVENLAEEACDRALTAEASLARMQAEKQALEAEVKRLQGTLLQSANISEGTISRLTHEQIIVKNQLASALQVEPDTYKLSNLIHAVRVLANTNLNTAREWLQDTLALE